MQTTLNVSLLAHTQVTDHWKEQWELASHVPDGQAVALTAIRTCYSPLKPQEIVTSEGEKYFSKPATDGEQGTEADRLIRHIMRSGHCYDDKTEVLTNEGFVLFKDLNKDMMIAMVKKDGVFSGFTDTWSYVEYDKTEHEGFIYEYDSRDISFGVTSQHRMFYSPGRYLKRWNVDTMQSIIDSGIKEYRMMRAPKKRDSSNSKRQTHYSNEHLKLIGFFIGDGYAQSDTRVSFHLKKKHKIHYLEGLLKKLDIDYTVYKTEQDTVKIRFSPDFFRPKDYYKDNQKTLNGLELLEGEEAVSLWEGLMASDGSYTASNKTHHYCTLSPYLEEEVITLATINGIPSKNDGHGRLSIQKKKHLAPFIQDSRRPENLVKKVEYNGKTFCVTVPTGILVVRRNGKILVCGNTSTMEHLSFTFMVSGLSRAALAQLTRHRVGFSYSVQSQRFVKFGSDDKSGGFEYVVPGNIASDKGKLSFFRLMMAAMQETYDDLRKNGVSAEDARAVLPQAAACNLTMTANLRSIIDFYRKRGPHTHAQAEIQDLAVQMREVVTEAEPWTDMFFGEGAE